MIGCFYRRLPAQGHFQAFSPTDDTRSNWGPELQHGSPPLALLTKLIEEQAAGSGLRIGRLSLEILGAIPVRPLRAHAWVERPGSRISMIVAELLAERDGGEPRAVARVSAWLLAVSDTAEVASDRYLPLVEGRTEPLGAPFADAGGYFDAIDWRQQQADGEAAVAWFSTLVHIVDTEPMTALQHRCSSASASGRRRFRTAGPRVDRTRRHRGDNGRGVRPGRVHRDDGADDPRPAQVNPG
jgi:hypothetical protein